MTYEDNPKSIKYYVKRYLKDNAAQFKGKQVVDFPAGTGVTSRLLLEVGATPLPFDLFPEYFKTEGAVCQRANIKEGLPLESSSQDFLICQEGIEHFSDQYEVFKEFSRVLKKGGKLLITTPNYSNLRSKVSYLVAESERFNTYMPPNELDDIWMSRQEISREVYFGHIFLLGIQKLRVFGRLTGFGAIKVLPTRPKSTSVLLLPLLYPMLYLFNWIAYRNRMRKNKDYDKSVKKAVYAEQFALATSYVTLTHSHLVVEYTKEQDWEDVSDSFKSRHKGFAYKEGKLGH